MNNDTPLVSVIVLTYNHMNYIRQALDSILMQKTDFSFEVLVGDDASSDQTPEILRGYAEQYPNTIRLFCRSENLGATRNAYELLMQAKGKYLAFCEGDDFWLDSEKLTNQVNFLENNPSFVGCSHRCLVVDAQGNKKQDQRITWVREKEVFTLNDFKGIYLPGQTATIVKRNIFLGKKDPYPFLYSLNRNISDRTTTLLYLTMGNFGFISKVMSAYRQTGTTGITNQLYRKNQAQIRNELEYTDQLNALAEELSGSTDVFLSYYRQLYAWAVIWFIKNPSRFNYCTVKLTAQKLGKGLFHPIALCRGMWQRLKK